VRDGGAGRSSGALARPVHRMDAVNVRAGWAACTACAAMMLAACDAELAPSQPWQSIDQLRAPRRAEQAPPGAMGSARPASADPLRVVTYNTEYGQDPQALADAILGDPALARA